MNFRTTLVLLILVVIVGIFVFVAQEHPKATSQQQAEGNGHKLLDLDAKDISKLAITNSDGKKTVLEKTGADWKLLEPVKADCKSWEVETLVNDITGLQSRGQVDASQKAAGGLDHPSFVVEITGKEGRVTKLQVGDKQSMGDTLLVMLDDRAKPDVVSNSLFGDLDKPASTYRKSQLVDVAQDQIKQLTIKHGKQTIKLEKKGSDWEETEPKAMPADSSAVSDLLFAITGLNAVDFVSDDASKAAEYDLNRPKLTVWYSTAAPTTQPSSGATTQPAGVEIRFGAYEDLLKRNLFVEVDHGPIAKVPATSETSFEKSPLDLRNKEVVSIDPEKVKSFTIQVEQSATPQPATPGHPATTRPAELREFTIERLKEEPVELGPVLPATRPAHAATQPSTRPALATTQPTTEPAVATTEPATQPASKWFFVSGGQGDAEEDQVKALLDALHPLRVEKYDESNPATQPAGTYRLSVQTTDGKSYSLRFTDPGKEGKLVGMTDDLTFELDRSLIEKLSGDFKTKKPMTISPPIGAPGLGIQ